MAYKKTVLLSLLIASIGLPKQALASPSSNLLTFGSGMLAGLALGYFYLTKKNNEAIKKLKKEHSEKNKQKHTCPPDNTQALATLTTAHTALQQQMTAEASYNKALIHTLEQENKALKEKEQRCIQTHSPLPETSINNSNASNAEEEKEVVEDKNKPSVEEQITKLTQENKSLKKRIEEYIQAQNSLLKKMYFTGKDYAKTFINHLSVLKGEDLSSKYTYNGIYFINIVETR